MESSDINDVFYRNSAEMLCQAGMPESLLEHGGWIAMSKPKAGLLPLYIKLYDDSWPEMRTRVDGF